MGDALDTDARDRRAAQGGEQDAAQAVAEGVAEALIERLDDECAAAFIGFLGGNAGDLESQWSWVPCVCVFRNLGDYLEYSSTISCSWTGAEISERSG